MSDLLGHKMQTQQMTQHILFSRLPSATENKWRSRRIILILFSLLKIMAYLTVCFFFHLQAIFKLLLLLQPFVFLCTRIQSLRNPKHDGCILNIALDRSSHLLHMKHQSCIHLYEYQVLFFLFCFRSFKRSDLVEYIDNNFQGPRIVIAAAGGKDFIYEVTYC